MCVCVCVVGGGGGQEDEGRRGETESRGGRETSHPSQDQRTGTYSTCMYTLYILIHVQCTTVYTCTYMYILSYKIYIAINVRCTHCTICVVCKCRLTASCTDLVHVLA